MSKGRGEVTESTLHIDDKMEMIIGGFVTILLAIMILVLHEYYVVLCAFMIVLAKV